MLADRSGQLMTSSTMDLLDTRPDTVTEVRHWVASKLTGLVGDLRNDILLVATELVSNAYDHGGGPRLVRVSRSDTPWLVLVEVADTNRRLPTVGNSRFGAETHRGSGLVLVDSVASGWGITFHRDTDGKTVWAQFTRSSDTPTTGGNNDRPSQPA
jgi:two-component sensor histidine kinase